MHGVDTRTHIRQLQLEFFKLSFLDEKMHVIEVFNDDVVPLGVDFGDDGFDGCVAFDQDACVESLCQRMLIWGIDSIRLIIYQGVDLLSQFRILPLIALGIMEA